MGVYRKKPIVVEAWPVRELNLAAQYAWDELPESVRADYERPPGVGAWVFGALIEERACPVNAEHVVAFDQRITAQVHYCPICGAAVELKSRRGIYVPTLEGNLFADPDDWIIRGVEGEFYPCKPSVFEATYEAVAPA